VNKLTVATSFPVFPPRGGGQRRIYDLYSEVARRGVAVDVVALSADREGVREIAPGLREIRVLRTPEHTLAERALERSVDGVPVTDIGLTLLHDLTPAYATALAESARDAAAVVVSHPYALPAVPDGVPVIYEAHNVEADLKDAILPQGELADAARQVEADSCARAELVLTCSVSDLKRLDQLFGVDAMHALLVPNGVDPGRVAFTPPAERARLAAALGVGFQALFVGSWHEPNLVAARDIIAAAAQAPELSFLLVGGAGLAFEQEEDLPDNVDICGIVADGFLSSVLAVAGAALNPMRGGSGTNLKMLDYMLAGLPVLSTLTGARGLDLQAGVHYIEAEPAVLAAKLAQVQDGDLAEMVHAAREHVLANFAWPVVVDSLLQHPRMQQLLHGVPA
jgi:glycosyltransferase involved in cell wall biosynthesis